MNYNQHLFVVVALSLEWDCEQQLCHQLFHCCQYTSLLLLLLFQQLSLLFLMFVIAVANLATTVPLNNDADSNNKNSNNDSNNNTLSLYMIMVQGCSTQGTAAPSQHSAGCRA